jgi:hypothetical protein
MATVQYVTKFGVDVELQRTVDSDDEPDAVLDLTLDDLDQGKLLQLRPEDKQVILTTKIWGNLICASQCTGERYKV